MWVDIDVTPDLLTLIQQKLCIVQYRYSSIIPVIRRWLAPFWATVYFILRADENGFVSNNWTQNTIQWCLDLQFETHEFFSVAGPTVWNSLPNLLRDPAIKLECFIAVIHFYFGFTFFSSLLYFYIANSGARTNLKVGGALIRLEAPEIFFWSCPSTFLALKAQWGTPGSLLDWWRHRRGGCLHCLLAYYTAMLCFKLRK